MLGWGLKIWDNIKYKILEPKWRQVFSIRHYVGIYIYESYIYIKCQCRSRKTTILNIPWSPKGPKERTVINIRNYIYNKSPCESHSQREQHASCSLKVKIVSKSSLSIFDYL